MVTWIAINADGSVFEPVKGCNLDNCILMYNVTSKLCLPCDVEHVVHAYDIQDYLEHNVLKVNGEVLDANVLTDEEQQRIQCMSKALWHVYCSNVRRKCGYIPRQYRWFFTTSTIMPSRRPRYARLVYHPSKELVQLWLSLLGQS